MSALQTWWRLRKAHSPGSCSYCPYSPECVEEVFSDVRLRGLNLDAPMFVNLAGHVSTGELRAIKWPRLFHTSHALPPLRLFALDALGEAGG
jgi:hypothetical protein